MGEGHAFLLGLQATGVLSIPTAAQAQEVWSSLLTGIQNGRAEALQEQRKQQQRDKVFAVGLTLLGVVLGTGLGWCVATFG